MKAGKIIKISSDGTTVSCLHADMLAELGRQSIIRASNVEFDNELGKWTVQILVGPDAGKYLDEVFDKRESALAAESEYLNDQLGRCLL
jgi:hypothetical protein